MRRAPGRAIVIEPVHMPEFGLDVSWAMCRNPMCENFGIQFRGRIEADRKQVTDEFYHIRVTSGPKKTQVGEIQCRYCGQSSRLHSSQAVRPIAQHFLSLSLPFAACPTRSCENYGVNLFEHWGEPGRYRKHRVGGARCCRCRAYVALGTPFAGKADADKKAAWEQIIEGVSTKRSVNSTFEVVKGLGMGAYYRHLDRIGKRLRDYHSYRNARLLRPDVPNREKALRIYTDVLDISLQAFEKEYRHVLLKYIVTTALVKRTIFVVAAHPYFLPERKFPLVEARRGDFNRLEFESEWGSVAYSTPKGKMTTSERLAGYPEIGRGGYFVRSPYAELAHFLVVQKMLTRFRRIYNYMDSARDLFPAALVAYRERILASRPDRAVPVDGRRRPPNTAEIVLFQHEKKKGKRGRQRKVEHTSRNTVAGEGKTRQARKRAALKKAWEAGEVRFRKAEDPEDLLKGKSPTGDPQVRASLFRRAFKGAYSKDGGWAWLEFPPASPAYRKPRSLWLTRMPDKNFSRHGKAVLMDATLQPVDAFFGAARKRSGAAKRPVVVAAGRGYSESYVIPAVVMGELWIFLLASNYARLRNAVRKKIAAEVMGLATPPRPTGKKVKKLVVGRRRVQRVMVNLPPKPKLDMLETAWDFRLGLPHAERITRWQSK